MPRLPFDLIPLILAFLAPPCGFPAAACCFPRHDKAPPRVCNCREARRLIRPLLTVSRDWFAAGVPRLWSHLGPSCGSTGLGTLDVLSGGSDRSEVYANAVKWLVLRADSAEEAGLLAGFAKKVVDIVPRLRYLEGIEFRVWRHGRKELDELFDGIVGAAREAKLPIRKLRAPLWNEERGSRQSPDARGNLLARCLTEWKDLEVVDVCSLKLAGPVPTSTLANLRSLGLVAAKCSLDSLQLLAGLPSISQLDELALNIDLGGIRKPDPYKSAIVALLSQPHLRTLHLIFGQSELPEAILRYINTTRLESLGLSNLLIDRSLHSEFTAFLRRAKRLRSLTMAWCYISDDDDELVDSSLDLKLPRLPALKELDLVSVCFDPRDLRVVAPGLQRLRFEGVFRTNWTRVTLDDCKLAIGALRGIREIDVCD